MGNASKTPLPASRGSHFAPKMPAFLNSVLIYIGKTASSAGNHTYVMLSLFGEVLTAFAQILAGIRPFRWNAFARHVREAGLNAIPIVALISFLMAIVLAYQGVAQLQLFGAQRYAINLVSISTLREMGGLLAAIMVAGRSGSSFTSEIGVMKIREEVDALMVMGLNPMDSLIIPRIAALLLVLPLLTVIAFLAGLMGGYVVAAGSLGTSFGTYLTLFAGSVSASTPWLGLMKAPVFALFIGLISCLYGLRVSGSADSIGRETTRSVVHGIFAVLVVDAMFSILFNALEW
jgi:phospholipid/cholesterol/gamma-HCH transport system permease protein